MGDLKGKIESEVEIKTISAEKFYNFKKETPRQVPNIATDHINAVALPEGDNWDNYNHGSIKIWKYTIDGISEELKERVEFDDENMTVTHVGLEGELFKEYKSFVIKYRSVPKGEGSLAKLSIEYEKLSPDVPPPTKYLNLVAGFFKDIEAHLLQKP